MTQRDPFFIIGTGRSGTTLLQRMLASHPGVVIPPETQFFSRFDPALRFSDPLQERDIDAYLNRVASDPWWGELGLSIDGLRAHLEGGQRGADSVLWWMLRELAEKDGSGAGEGVRFGEKTPHHERRIARIATLFPDAVFIHIVRDPRDVVVSLRKEAWWPWKSVQRTARGVRATLHRQRAAQRTLDARYCRLRYEDLVAEPERVLRELCAFIGMGFDERMLRYHETEATGFLESEAAWKGLSTQPLDPSRIGRWAQHLSARQAASVDHWIGRELMDAYGYEASGRGYSILDALRDGAERVWWFVSRQFRSIKKRLA